MPQARDLPYVRRPRLLGQPWGGSRGPENHSPALFTIGPSMLRANVQAQLTALGSTLAPAPSSGAP